MNPFTNEVLFEIIITDEKSQKQPLYSRHIDPENNPDDRKWFDEKMKEKLKTLVP